MAEQRQKISTSRLTIYQQSLTQAMREGLSPDRQAKAQQALAAVERLLVSRQSTTSPGS